MKKVVTLIAAVLFLNSLHSQTTLAFCAFVNDNGYCFFNNNQFVSSPDSMEQRIFIQAKNEKTFTGTSKIIFKIYSVAKNGVESYESSTDQNVEGNWIFAWVPHTFKSPGEYKVKIYNDKEELLCNKGLKFFANK